MKNQKGITLIALVVTIVVLLILAGTAIAMLQGDNGIITNAQKAQAANTEGDVRSRVEMAVNSAKTIALARSSTDPDYNAQDSDKEKEIVKNIISDLGLTVPEEISDSELVTDEKGYTVGLASHVLTITYEDSQFTTGKKVAEITLEPITAEITIGTDNVTYEYTYNDANNGERLVK